MGTGTGLPSPKCFDNAVVNGADREVIITPDAEEHVVLYDAVLGDDASTPTSFQVLLGSVMVAKKTITAGAANLGLTQHICFAKGEAVTVRAKDTTVGTIKVCAGLQR